jgi:hypothetical protein
VSSFPKSTYRILSGIGHREARFGISSMQCGIRTLRQKADPRSPLYQESRGRAVLKLVFKVQIRGRTSHLEVVIALREPLSGVLVPDESLFRI